MIVALDTDGILLSVEERVASYCAYWSPGCTQLFAPKAAEPEALAEVTVATAVQVEKAGAPVIEAELEVRTLKIIWVLAVCVVAQVKFPQEALGCPRFFIWEV